MTRPALPTSIRPDSRAAVGDGDRPVARGAGEDRLSPGEPAARSWVAGRSIERRGDSGRVGRRSMAGAAVCATAARQSGACEGVSGMAAGQSRKGGGDSGTVAKALAARAGVSSTAGRRSMARWGVSGTGAGRSMMRGGGCRTRAGQSMARGPVSRSPAGLSGERGGAGRVRARHCPGGVRISGLRIPGRSGVFHTGPDTE